MGKSFMESTKSRWTQLVHDRLITLVLAMLVIVPLIAVPLSNAWNGSVSLAYEGLALALLATILLRAKWDLRREKVVAFLKTGVNTPVLAFFGIVLLSVLFSPEKQQSAQAALQIGAGVLLYFAAAYQFRRSEHLSRLVDTLLFVAIAASLIGFATFSMSDRSFTDGLFGDHQLLGSFLMILFPVVAVMAITSKEPKRQMAAQVAAVLTAACLLLVQCRSAWAGAGAGLVVLGGLALLTSNRKARQRNKSQAVLPLALLVLAGGFFITMWPHAESIFARAETMSHATEQASFQSRLGLWQTALRMVAAHPFTGVGVGRYGYEQYPYQGSGLPIGLLHMAPSLSENAHSFYLQSLAELGVPGALALLVILITFFVTGVGRVRKMEPGIRRHLLIGAIAAIACFMVDAISSPSWQFGQIMMFFWLMLGIGVACSRHMSRREEPVSQTLSTATRNGRRASMFCTAGLTLLLPLVGFAAGTNAYRTVTSISITPAAYTTLDNYSPHFDVIGHLSDGTTTILTTDPSTHITFAGGTGSASSGTYTPSLGEVDVVTVNATYLALTAVPATLTVQGHGYAGNLTLAPYQTTTTVGTPTVLTATATFQDGFVKDVTGTTAFSIQHGTGILSGNTYTATRTEAAVIQGNYTDATGKTTTNVAYVTENGNPNSVQSINVSPKTSSVQWGTPVAFTVIATMWDGSSKDVSNDPATVYTVLHGTGSVSGNAYTAIQTEAAIIQVSYTSGGLTAIGNAYVTETYKGDGRITSSTFTQSATTVATGTPVTFTFTVTYQDGVTKDVSKDPATHYTIYSGLGTLTDNSYTSSHGEAAVIEAVYTDPTTGQVQSKVAYINEVAPPVLTGITVTPNAPTVSVGTTVTFTVTAHFSDGSSTDITGSANYSVPSGYGSGSGNLFTPTIKANAPITITYTFGAVTKTVQVYVRAS